MSASAATIAASVARQWRTPPELAREAGVEPPKIIGWIKRGELRAVNLADRKGGRPRYRVNLTDWVLFLESRSTVPTPKPSRIRRKQGAYTPKYFAS